MTSGISGGEKEWASFCLFVVVVVYLCVHSHVHIYTMHSVDNIPGGGKIKTHSKKGSNSLNWNVLERSVPSIQGLCSSHQVGCRCCDMVRLLQVCGVIDG